MRVENEVLKYKDLVVCMEYFLKNFCLYLIDRSGENCNKRYSLPTGLILALFFFAGTRIIYDRKFLLDCRSSPLAHTPPSCLPDIPGVTSPPKNNKTHPRERVSCSSSIPPVDKATGTSCPLSLHFI